MQLPKWIKQAGASSESDTDRNGFLSHKAESHALGIGFGLGFIGGKRGNLRYVGGLLAVILYGNRGDTTLSGDLVTDVRKELPYFLVGVVCGFVLGVGTDVVISYV